MTQLASVFLAAADTGGAYISVGKIIPVIIVLIVWARLLTWADKDEEDAHLPREALNLALLLGMVLAFALFLFMPNYAVALLAFILIFLVEVGVYLGLRNSKVGLKDLKQQISDAFKGEKKGAKVIAGAVTFINAKSGQAIAVPDTESPDKPAYDALQQLLTDPLVKGAERIDLTPADGASQVRFFVDGVPYNATSIDRTASAAAVSYIKPLAGLNVDEKRKPQTGTMKVQLEGKKKEIEVSTAGSAAGEFLKILVDPKSRFKQKIEELGMTPDQLEAVKHSVREEKGIVIVCAPRQQGLSTMLYAILRAHDAFIQHIQSIERSPDADLEGVTQNKLAASASAAEEAKQVSWTLDQEPDVFMINQIEDPDTARKLIEFVKGGAAGRRVYVGMRANSTFDALRIWRKMVGDDALAVSQLNMIICGRIMRKLCMACKVAYTPDPEQLKKLNLNPASASKLFQARREPLRDPKGNPIPCEFCKELRYNGRFGVYELLIVDEDFRNVVTSGGSENQLKAAFRKRKGKLLQEMALAAVENGDTSLAEVKRVMEAGAPAPAAGGGGGAARGAARPPVKPAAE